MTTTTFALKLKLIEAFHLADLTYSQVTPEKIDHVN